MGGHVVFDPPGPRVPGGGRHFGGAPFPLPLFPLLRGRQNLTSGGFEGGGGGSYEPMREGVLFVLVLGWGWVLIHFHPSNVQHTRKTSPQNHFGRRPTIFASICNVFMNPVNVGEDHRALWLCILSLKTIVCRDPVGHNHPFHSPFSLDGNISQLDHRFLWNRDSSESPLGSCEIRV